MSGPREADPVLAVGSAFKAAIAALRRMRGREGHHPGELSEAQYWLLFSLCERSPLSTSELALAADLSAASTTEMLEGLERAGLVVRTRSETDRRVVLTSLTPRGQELVLARRERSQAKLRAALADFTPEELAVAADVLVRLQAMFDERGVPPQAPEAASPSAPSPAAVRRS